MKNLAPCVAILSGLFASQASATCTQANMAGTWNAYSVGQTNTGLLDWVGCTLVIGSTGNFSLSNSVCVASTGQTTAAKGSLKLDPTKICVFRGTIYLAVDGGTRPLQSVTMSMSKDTATGIGGGLNSGYGAFVFNIVKIK